MNKAMNLLEMIDDIKVTKSVIEDGKVEIEADTKLGKFKWATDDFTADDADWESGYGCFRIGPSDPGAEFTLDGKKWNLIDGPKAKSGLCIFDGWCDIIDGVPENPKQLKDMAKEFVKLCVDAISKKKE